MIDHHRATSEEVAALLAYQRAAIALANTYDVTSDPNRLRPFLDDFRAARTAWEASQA